MKPTLIINGHDYTGYVEELTPTPNSLDSDESGRDVQTGYMYRTIIAWKQDWQASFLPIPEDIAKQLFADVSTASGFYDARILDPTTNTVVTKTFYTAAVPFGVQRWKKTEGKTYYYGISLKMTER